MRFKCYVCTQERTTCAGLHWENALARKVHVSQACLTQQQYGLVPCGVRLVAQRALFWPERRWEKAERGHRFHISDTKWSGMHAMFKMHQHRLTCVCTLIFGGLVATARAQHACCPVAASRRAVL